MASDYSSNDGYTSSECSSSYDDDENLDLMSSSTINHHLANAFGEN